MQLVLNHSVNWDLGIYFFPLKQQVHFSFFRPFIAYKPLLHTIVTAHSLHRKYHTPYSINMGLRTVIGNVIADIKSDVETVAFVLFNCKISRRHRRLLQRSCHCDACDRTGAGYQINPGIIPIDAPPPYSPSPYSSPSYPPYPPPPYCGTRSRLDTFLDDFSYYSPEY